MVAPQLLMSRRSKLHSQLCCSVIAHLFRVLWCSGYPQHTMIFLIPLLPFRFHFFPLLSASRRLVTQSSSQLAPRHSASVTRQLAAERDSSSAVTSIHVCAFYSYSILRRICTACRSPSVYYLDVLSLCKYSFSNCPRWLPCFFQIKNDSIDRCKTFTSQDLGSFSIISSIYVCAFHSYSILRRICPVRCSPSVYNLDVLSLLKLPTLVTLFSGNPKL